MLDQLTFSWFVDTCNLSHLATGPQEALWNTIKETATSCYIELINILLGPKSKDSAGQTGSVTKQFYFVVYGYIHLIFIKNSNVILKL